MTMFDNSDKSVEVGGERGDPESETKTQRRKRALQESGRLGNPTQAESYFKGVKYVCV